MDNILINPRNSNLFHLHRLLLNLVDKKKLKKE